jgi:glutathione S-transferase
MHLFINTTSPFVRLVRIALAEKGLANKVKTEVVDPWADQPDFLKANPAGRVPVLTTDDGTVISESYLILRWLDSHAPEPAIFPEEDLANTLSKAAYALAAAEAATSVIIGRKSNEAFDMHMVGQRRFRTIADAFARLDADLPRDMDDRVDIANIATITLIDYVLFRYLDRDWLSALPRLAGWHERQKDRPSVRSTRPYV